MVTKGSFIGLQRGELLELGCLIFAPSFGPRLPGFRSTEGSAMQSEILQDPIYGFDVVS